MRKFASLLILGWTVAAALLPLPQALAESLTSLQTLNWQKLEFERQLRSELNQTLTPLIPATHYLLEIAVQIRQRPRRLPPQLPKTEDAKPPGDETSLLLSKLGLWAPVPAPAPQSGVEMIQDDVFDFIDRLAVTLVLDDAVTDERAKLAEELVQSKVRTYSRRGKVTVSRAPLSTPEKGSPSWQKQWASELKYPLTALVCSILFVAVLLLNTRNWLKMEREKIAVLETQGKSSEKSVEESPALLTPQAEAARFVEAASAFAANPSASEASTFGLDRMKLLIERKPHEASLLIKQWLAAKPQHSDAALAYMGRALSTDELTRAAVMLSEDERKTWAKALGGAIATGSSAVEVQVFLANQVSESVLNTPPVTDQDIRELFASLTPKECVACAQSNTMIGGMLLNYLNTMQVARMLSLLPKDLVNPVIEASAQIDRSNMPALAAEAKTLIDQIRARSAAGMTPFLKKSTELIREIHPDSEGLVFTAIARSGAVEMLDEVSKLYLPAELVPKLPAICINTVLNKFPTAMRGEIIYNRGPEGRAPFLAAIGETGKMRELIDVELQEIENDPARKALADARAQENWRKFVNQMRELVRGDRVFASQTEPARQEWLQLMASLNPTGGTENARAA